MELIPLETSPEKVIDDIIDKLKKKYKSKLLFVGGKGSLANEKFTPLSDIDLVVCLSEGKEEYREFLYGTTYIDIRVASFSKLKKELEDIDMVWPLKAGGILNLKLFYKKDNSFEKLKKVYENVRKDKRKFENAVELNTFVEYYSKSYRAFKNKEYEQLFWASFELYHQFAFIIALLNKEYFTEQGPMKFIKQIEKFEYKPRGCMEAIKLSMSRKPKKSFKGVKKMWEIVNKLSEEFDFKSNKIDSLEEIKF